MDEKNKTGKMAFLFYFAFCFSLCGTEEQSLGFPHSLLASHHWASPPTSEVVFSGKFLLALLYSDIITTLPKKMYLKFSDLEKV